MSSHGETRQMATLGEIGDLRRVFLTSAYPQCPRTNFGAAWLRDNADLSSRVLITDDAEEAGVVLFVENHPGQDPYFRAMHGHPLYRRFKDKCVLYHDADLSVTTVRTISPSIERWQFNANLHRTAHYIARLCENDGVNEAKPLAAGTRRYLFSFLGSARTHPIRREVLKLKDPEAYLRDTSRHNAWELAPEERRQFQNHFAEVLRESAFVLCPRGIGPATYRLFECMQLARAPVIIADDWVAPAGPDWERFSIRIPEAEVHSIPDLLRAHALYANDMGVAARDEWERWFSPSQSLKTLAVAANELLRIQHGYADKLHTLLQFCAPYHARGIARHVYRSARSIVLRHVSVGSGSSG